MPHRGGSGDVREDEAEADSAALADGHTNSPTRVEDAETQTGKQAREFPRAKPALASSDQPEIVGEFFRRHSLRPGTNLEVLR